MPYEVTILCELRRGNPLQKLRCHSDAQAKARQPHGEHTTSRLALSMAEASAINLGWKKWRRAGRSMVWLCPVCKEE